MALALCHYGELPVSAAREEELQAEKEENTRKLTDINEKVNDLEYQKQQMLSDIDTLDQKLVSVLAQIELLDEQITGKRMRSQRQTPSWVKRKRRKKNSMKL